MSLELKKQDLDSWLDSVDYSALNTYVPSEFALVFMNFIKLVNGEQGESHKTPPVHLKMLDKIAENRSKLIANLCFRGAAKALDISTEILTTEGWSTIGKLKVGQRVFGEDGLPTTVIAKSELFNKPMYRLTLGDGRSLDVSEDHINVIIQKRVKRINGKCHTYYDRRELTTKELLDIPLGSTRKVSTSNPKGWENSVWIPCSSAIELPEQTYPIEPYLLGLLLGDGSFNKETGYARLHSHKEDLPFYLPYIPSSGSVYSDARNENVKTVGVLGIGVHIKDMGLNVHGDMKFIPESYLHGSVEQRLAILQGLMDTDGTVNKATPSFASNSLRLAQGVQYLVYSLGGVARLTQSITDSDKIGYRVSINLGMPVFRLQRKLIKATANVIGKVPLISVARIDDAPSQCIAVDNSSKTFLAGDFVVTHNTTLFMEYFSLFLGVFNILPGFGQVEGMIYISDSMDNGVKSARKNIEFRYNNSPFLQEWIPEATFTDNYIEFVNKSGKRLGIKMFGAKALSLDTVLYLAAGGVTTIGDCSVGDSILGADGLPTTITKKSGVFHKPMYELQLDDGRSLKVSEDHLNQVHLKKFKSDKTFSSCTLTEETLSTQELLGLPLHAKDPNGSMRPLVWVENVRPLVLPHNNNILLDPYTVGLLLGDGSLNPKASGGAPLVLTAHKDDWPTYEAHIPYVLGKPYQKDNVVSRTIVGIKHLIAAHGLDKHGDLKAIPEDFLFSSVEQRLALLQGLMDTDGAISKDGKPSFSSNSKLLVEGVMWLVRSLGGTARWVSTGKPTHYRTLIRLDMPLTRLARKAVRQKPCRSNLVSISAIVPISMEPSQCIAVDNEERQFAAGVDLVRTHNTGLRGTKIYGKRPVLAILDDLVSDDDSKSKASMQTIKDTVYKGVFHALDPTRRKVVFNGTPFNKEDILIEAVESGAWDVNVWPVCERFPCTKEEFVGAWEDRFSYEFIKDQYEMAEKTGKLSSFYQELMLRITSEDERLVQDAEIRWYSRTNLMKNPGHFNFYITTDLATSAKEVADYSVVSVWAYNSNGDWFWVDGITKKQLINKTWDDLFRLIAIYKPQAVGIEINGQQQGYIPYLQREMMVRNVWFNFASSGKNGEPGIRSQGDKLSRFNMVVPWFKMGKIYFPEEMRESGIMRLFMEQIRLVTQSGIKGKDDCIDTISQLGMLNPWRPSESMPLRQGDGGVWEADDEEDSPSALQSYIV